MYSNRCYSQQINLGKSSRSKAEFPHYVCVNQDTLKSKQKSLAVARAALIDGSSVIVDSTNPSRESRREWVALAASVNAPVLSPVLFMPTVN